MPSAFCSICQVYKTKRKEKPSTRKLIYRQTVEELLIAIVLANDMCPTHTHPAIHIPEYICKVYTFSNMGRTLNCIGECVIPCQFPRQFSDPKT